MSVKSTAGRCGRKGSHNGGKKSSHSGERESSYKEEKENFIIIF